MIIELTVGSIIAGFLFWRQKRTSDKVDKLIIDKAKAEQEKKEFECQRIIGHLHDVYDMEESLKTFLTNYKVGEQTNELIFHAMSFQSHAKNSIRLMHDAIEQLQHRLNDNSLRQEFLEYLGWFNLIPTRILDHNNLNRNKNVRVYFLILINKWKESNHLSVNSVKKWLPVNYSNR